MIPALAHVMVRHAEYVVASCVVAALGPPVALSLARPSTTMIADLRHRQLMRGDRGARFRVISNYQPRRRRVVVSRIPVEHGLRERDGVFRISRFHGLRRRRHDQRGPNCRDAGPRDLGAAGRGKRGHVPYLGGSLGPEKVGQPAAADAPELRAAVRVKRYSPTVPAMVGPPLVRNVPGVRGKQIARTGHSRLCPPWQRDSATGTSCVWRR